MASPDRSDPAQAEEDGLAMLPPDHPLLQRVQNKLKEQLESSKRKLVEELRQRQNEVAAAKKQREQIGVELYGFQQNLAKLQLALEESQSNYQSVNDRRLQVENELARAKKALAADDVVTRQERAQAEKSQAELDALAATVKQVEAYNEQMKSEIAVTRRAAYAAEGAVSKLEKEKQDQDFRINTMQENIKSLQQQSQLYTAQHEAQKRETRAAQETLAEAQAEMESVQFEKKQLMAQWKSSLLATAKRDEALSAIQDGLREQQQQEISVDVEASGYRRDITKEQLKNEQLTSVLKKVEGESAFVMQQIEGVLERQARLQEVYVKLAKSLEHTEEQIKRNVQEYKSLQTDSAALDRAILKASQQIREIEDEMLKILSEQTTAEISSSKTVADARELRKKIRDEELSASETQNELAKLQVDILNTEAHNTRLVETLKLLNDEIDEKSLTINKYESEIKRRNDEIEKKTRDIDLLNRRYERMVDGQEDPESTGPLEATIHNLQREMETKGVESKDLQRRWIGYQTELVSLINENSGLSETVTRMRAEHTILIQKKRRLDQQCEQYKKEVKATKAAMGRLHVELQRVNALIAANSDMRNALQEDNFNLEFKIVGELKDLEEEAARLQSSIDETRASKRDVLAEIVEVERQIMLWERKIQLEKEMQEVMDPNVGQDVVGEMKKEIHRMQLRLSELLRLQETLMLDMEKALERREMIGMKGKAVANRAKTKANAAITRQQLDKAVGDLQRSVKDTEREIAATEQRSAALDAQRTDLAGRLTQLESSCQSLRAQEEQLRVEMDAAATQRYTLLLATVRHNRASDRVQAMIAGKFKSQVAAGQDLDTKLTEAEESAVRVVNMLDQLKATLPHLTTELDRILCHVARVE